MNPQEESDSMLGMINCMQALGFKNGVRSQMATAKVKTQRYDFPHGEIDVSFDFVDSFYGCEINCESDIMRGFSIAHGNFRPWFQKFSFDSRTLKLTISSEDKERGYRFTSCFRPPTAASQRT